MDEFILMVFFGWLWVFGVLGGLVFVADVALPSLVRLFSKEH